MNPVLFLPVEMIQELALGLDPPTTVAAKYGYDLKEFVRISNLPWFADAILREKERQRDEGYTWNVKLELMHQSAFEDAFKVVKSGTVKFSDHVEFLKLTADMTGQRKPQQAMGSGGPAFQINITIPEGARGPTNVKDLIQGDAETKVEPMVIDLSPRPSTPSSTSPRPAPRSLPPVASMFPVDDTLAGPGPAA